MSWPEAQLSLSKIPLVTSQVGWTSPGDRAAADIMSPTAMSPGRQPLNPARLPRAVRALPRSRIASSSCDHHPPTSMRPTSMLALVALAALLATASARVERAPKLQCGSGWGTTGRTDPTTQHTVKIVLTSQNAEILENAVLAVSDPRSPSYGEYLSKDQVNELTAPLPEHVSAVAAWLDQAEVSYTTDHEQGTITIRDSVAKIEGLFRTQISNARQIQTKQAVLRASDYEIPAELDDAIASVFGMHGLPLPPRVPTASNGSPPPVTPDVLAKAYTISGVNVTGSLKNRQAVVEFQGLFMNDTDLATFFKMYLPSVPAADTKVYATHGAKKQGNGQEADLDIQYIMGVAPGIKTEFYEQANSDFCADVQNWTQVLLATEDVPLVHSVSYGYQGELSDIGCKEKHVSVIDTNFKKLAARGISIIIASGDGGSAYQEQYPPTPPCDDSNPGTKNVGFTGTVFEAVPTTSGPLDCCNFAHGIGTFTKYAGWTFVPGDQQADNCILYLSISANTTQAGATSGLSVPNPPPPPGPYVGKMFPSWPASSPWVTAVGSTRFINDVPGGPEGAVSLEDYFGSGGGFSTMWDVAEWQKEAVAHYFKTVDPSTLPNKTKASYAAGGRGTPDVSTLGTGYQIINDGRVTPSGGTSASTPVFAAIVSLLNEARLNAGKKPLGFLNPWIYQNPDSFVDITYGWDRIGRVGQPLSQGFNCSAGWDPITGVGTPIFPKLLASALATK